MEIRFRSGDVELAGHIARPARVAAGKVPAVVICHGFPSAVVGAADAAPDFPELADRVSSSMGWLALTFTFRGCGESGGDFSLGGWLTDVEAAVVHLRATESVEGVWLAGFGTGGALCLSAAAFMGDRVQGVATLGAPADFDDWASHPRRLLQHSRDVGAVRSPNFPPSLDAWSRELRAVRPVVDAGRWSPRPLLIVHGSDDQQVPPFDARVLSDAHGEAELRLIAGAGHSLRHDPRAIAVLLGWLDRQRQ